MSERTIQSAVRDITDISEQEATQICGFLDGQNSQDRNLFFESTVHNWDTASETLSVAITFKSEHVALQSLEDAVYAARFVHRGTEAA